MKSGIALLALLLIAAVAAPARVWAQTYPVRPVRLVVPLSPGGGADTLGRYVAKHLTDGLGQQVIVENRAGGGGVVGGEYVARAAPDGYTLIVGGTGQLVSSLTHRRVDFQKDFTPVAMVMDQPALLVVHPSLPVKSTAELIRFVKARPGQLNYGSSGNGGSGHLFMEMFKAAAGIDIVHIPYKGAGPALAEVMAGQVPLLLSSPLGTLQVVRAGRVRALAVSSARRMTGAPEIPTIAESGLPGFDATGFLGILGPAGLPRDIVAKLSAETIKIAQRRDVQEWLAAQGGEAAAGTPEQFAARIAREKEKLGKVVRDVGIRVD